MFKLTTREAGAMSAVAAVFLLDDAIQDASSIHAASTARAVVATPREDFLVGPMRRRGCMRSLS